METKPRKKRKRPESIFLKNFGASWRAAGGYWYKIPDATGMSAMFSPKRPYDVNAAINKDIFVIEGKYCKTIQFSLDQMEDHQIPALKEAQQAGYLAYVLVCYDRLKARVADFYRLDALLKAEAEGRKWLTPTEADLRFYATNTTDWEISAVSVKTAVHRAQRIEPNLFEFR